ncbi:uncharacterized protein LOC113289633 isoform X2 [Papaver somniferum]|uniref:uncharacterized protein LOC113289633 isoform X2 n=1 Tax=Papaver somniferum TaxID=3469 RepID=UPI000E6FCCE5|nr:uncharacterized protein LOC113289633 isoform X2 [Papaver somniferum]
MGIHDKGRSLSGKVVSFFHPAVTNKHQVPTQSSTVTFPRTKVFKVGGLTSNCWRLPEPATKKKEKKFSNGYYLCWSCEQRIKEEQHFVDNPNFQDGFTLQTRPNTVGPSPVVPHRLQCTGCNTALGMLVDSLTLAGGDDWVILKRLGYEVIGVGLCYVRAMLSSFINGLYFCIRVLSMKEVISV